jgi:hypothetical protein
MNNIELIRQKCIEANPEIENTYVLDSFWEINKVETAGKPAAKTISSSWATMCPQTVSRLTFHLLARIDRIAIHCNS